MTNDLLIIEGNTVKRYIMKKSAKPMTVVRQRLYRTDNRLKWRDKNSDSTFVIYDLDGIEPWGIDEPFITPDETMALIDAGRPNKKSNVGILDGIANMDGKNLFWIAIAAIILLAALRII